MPFDPASISAPFRMQPGLRRRDAGARQLTPNRPGSPQLAAKLAVLRSEFDQALCALPGFDSAPALRALRQQALREAPEAWREPSADQFEAPLLGWSLRGPRHEVVGDGPVDIGRCLTDLPLAWRVSGLLCLAFAEDFAVLEAASTRIPWLAVCLPSHWAPTDKIGRPFAEVHAPVADNRLLLQAANALARLVCEDGGWVRDVWTLTPLPSHDAHPRRQAPPAWPERLGADELAARTWLRTEHQTFIALPDRSQAVFTILVEMQPLTAVAPAILRRLQPALASMGPAVLAYRGLVPARDRLLDWIGRHGSDPA